MNDEITYSTIQSASYRKSGFASERDARDHLNAKWAECSGYNLVQSSINKTPADGWEVYFLGYRR